MALIHNRKHDHLDSCATDDVNFKEKSTLFECVSFIHDALPDLSLDEIDTSASLLEHKIAAPLVIAAMTGGVDRAEAINRDLAKVAESRNIAFGFGSMRPLLRDSKAPGYNVRDVAPSIPILGNIGVVQAQSVPSERLREITDRAGCSALVIHLNPSMELIQAEGDRDFRGGLDTISRLVDDIRIPIIVKETGAGISRAVAQRLVSIGVRHIDTSGAGGTSWVGVETLRASEETKAFGKALWDWGIPTAACVMALQDLELEIIATGGVYSGLDVAKAIALGATAAGIARPILQAHHAAGIEGATAKIDEISAILRRVMLLTGSANLAALRDAPRLIEPTLARWNWTLRGLNNTGEPTERIV